MPKFSQRSKDRLNTCHEDLVRLFTEVIKHYDCTILEGQRTPERQAELVGRARARRSPASTLRRHYQWL